MKVGVRAGLQVEDDPRNMTAACIHSSMPMKLIWQSHTYSVRDSPRKASTKKTEAKMTTMASSTAMGNE